MSEELDSKERQLEKIHSTIFEQALQSERFLMWWKANFDVHKIRDEENNEIRFQVIEVPMELATERLATLLAEKRGDTPQVELATEKDLAEMVED